MRAGPDPADIKAVAAGAAEGERAGHPCRAGRALCRRDQGAGQARRAAGRAGADHQHRQERLPREPSAVARRGGHVGAEEASIISSRRPTASSASARASRARRGRPRSRTARRSSISPTIPPTSARNSRPRPRALGDAKLGARGADRRDRQQEARRTATRRRGARGQGGMAARSG